MCSSGSRTGSPGSIGKERLGTLNSRKTVQWGGSVDFSVGRGDSWSWDWEPRTPELFTGEWTAPHILGPNWWYWGRTGTTRFSTGEKGRAGHRLMFPYT